MIGRRGFLLGGLGVVIAGIGGTGVAGVTHRGRRWLHAAGVLAGGANPAPSSGAAVQYGTLLSSALRRTVSYAVAMPPGVATGPLPIVYALHGRGQDHTFAVEHIRLQDFLAAPDVRAVVVSVDGGPASYWHPRRDGTDALGMLVDELVPRLDAEIGDGRRAIVGWSMGGYGALLAAERRADLFRVVVAAAPALWRSANEAAPGAFDSPLDFKAHDVFTGTDRLAGSAVRLDCGRDDPFLEATEAFAALVPGIELHVRKGFHDAATWRGMAPDQAAFLGGHLAS